MKYKPSQKIILKENPEEGWSEQEATIVEYEGNGMYIVDVTPEYKGDDGIREVHEDNIL